MARLRLQHGLLSTPRLNVCRVQFKAAPFASLSQSCNTTARQCTRNIPSQVRPRYSNLSAANKATPTSSVYARYASSSETNPPLRRTALYDLHVRHGGKMVPFGGYSMPVQYSDLSITESHHWTRQKASLFDVGHMVQHRISGPGATALLRRLTPSSITTLPLHQSTLSVLLHPATGGIVDDTVIARLGPETFYVVTNAANREKDIAYLREHISALTTSSPGPNVGAIHWEVMEDWGLLALQGPLAPVILSELVSAAHDNAPSTDLSKLYFGQSVHVDLQLPPSSAAATTTSSSSPPPKSTVQLLVSRAGYTGEDGFEISIPPGSTSAVAQALLTSAGPDRLRLAGLGARDSLRLEAGMCLYGHDLDDTTTPVEAALSWVIGKDRRDDADPTSSIDAFFGAEVILPQLRPAKDVSSASASNTGVQRRRVGLIVDGAPAREGAAIVLGSGNSSASSTSPTPAAGAAGGGAVGKAEVVGKVTSGCPSPTLGKNIAMAYVRNGLHKAGTELEVLVRGKPRRAVVTKMPFVPAKYYKGPR
ncbi:MAG: hypothetical protein M1825_004113 [Sarcosagium campestre]|nr:MAG: hypothetical protein M1825_004113 [Sarcosagium campestre]